MKIAIIGSLAFDSLEYHLNEAFNYNGHKCNIFDIYNEFLYEKKIGKYFKKIDWLFRSFVDSYDVSVWNRVTNKVLEYEPDLIIGVYRFIHPQFVYNVKKKKIKVIHINPDQLTTLEKGQLFVEKYDAYFTKDAFMYRFMHNNLRLNVFLYNEAFNPRIHLRPEVERKALEKEVDIDVLAFGNMYPYRNRMLSNLKYDDFQLSIYGAKTLYFPVGLNDNFRGNYILGSEKARLIYGSKIVFNNLHYAEIESVNNKFFEINGCGGFQLCDYRPVLEELLPVDPDLVSFRSIDEAVEKVRYYKDRPEERYKICRLIYDHFLQNYTYDHLINYILKVI